MTALLLDTNVLLLFLVGNKHRDQIGKKRLSSFDDRDLNLVNQYAFQIKRHITLPNILSEVSNFIGSGKQQWVPDGSELLKKYSEAAEESYFKSVEHVQNSEFHRIGLTDTAILRLARDDAKVLTVDNELYGRLVANSIDAINILHFKTPRR